MNQLLKNDRHQVVSTRVRFVVALIAFAAVFCLWVGCTTMTPSRGAANAPVVPDAEGQRKFLTLARAEYGTVTTEWQPMTTFNFDDPATLESLRVFKGEWKISDGQLRTVGGKTEDNRTIILAPCAAEPMRIEFDAILYARADGRIGDLYLRLNADPVTGGSEKGYALITARYFNQDTVCYKLNQPIARTEWSPIVPGQQHHIIAEWETKHLRLYIDGKVVMDAWDREKPIAADPAKWIALSSYDTDMSIDNFTVAVPKKK